MGQFTIKSRESSWPGVVRSDGKIINIYETGQEINIDFPDQLQCLINKDNWEQQITTAIKSAEEKNIGIYDESNINTLEPITNPQKIIAVGLNYKNHANESGGEPPEEPILFAKFPTAITGPWSKILWNPKLTSKVDYEGEFVVVIGEKCRNVECSEALKYVAGYTIGNDVSARDLQFSDKQWVRGKSLDTFAPIGPVLVTPSEIKNPHDLNIWTEVNDTRVQTSSTANLFFNINELISFCSQNFTLNPGDLLFTGTPAGVGIFREPSLLLTEGDTITVGIEKLGELTNKCEYY